MPLISQNQTGFSLVEVILAIAILGIGGTAIVMMLGNSYQSSQAASDRSEAGFLASQTYEAVRSIGQDAYNRLLDGTYGLDDADGSWDFAATSDLIGRFTRQVVIETALRDPAGDLSDVGSADIHTKKLTTTLDWDYLGAAKTFESVDYFTNWDSLNLWDDTVAEFNGGTPANTEITNWTDGEVALTAVGRILDPETYFDASNNHNANAVAVQGAVAYVVRDKNNGDKEMVAVDVADPEHPSRLGNLELGDTATDIVVAGDYAYVASIANGNEFMVINIANPAAMFVAASLNLSGNANALSVEIFGNRAYVTRAGSADPDIFIIDISTPTSPVEVGNFKLGATVYALALDEDNDILYIGSATNNSIEFHSLDVGNEASPVLLDGIGLAGNQNILELVLDQEHDIAYVGRYYNLGSQNIFSIDISDPNNLAVMSSLSTGGRANSLIFNEEFLFVATNKSDEEL
ncbi:prepilin-type N-terminal cleavage/methylation domain-containing protein, partial [Patescibacteria group bacterium]|nr:prepilin-type N-terminal cleavage/methylation domain-containing protein [Patescibacteria group bacterium]